jgi:GT2 family glycosyltransferase
MTAEKGTTGADERARAATPGDRPGGSAPASVTAVVLTHMRPRLAGDVTRSLLEVEGFEPDRIVVVVNGVGGLDEAALEAKVRTVRLPVNTGPAGGFRTGLVEAFSEPDAQWAYLCEDDVSLFALPAPRLAGLLGRIEALDGERPGARPVGAVVAYGRRFVGRGTHTVNVVSDAGRPGDLTRVDVGCWGATLVSRAVVDAGVLPDPEWFFGLEDFDFFCRVREAGFDVLVDDVAARQVAEQQTDEGRERAHRARRPTDGSEAWRRYYHSRNSLALVRRHGRPTWYGWQAAFAARQLQRARGLEERTAIVHGLWDGLLGRMGENPRYARSVGEFSPEGGPGAPDPEAR